MKKAFLVLAMTALFTALLAGCGGKDEGEVVDDLSKQVEGMDGYRAEMDLILQTGQDQDPHEYELETLFRKPDEYRISLTNKEREMTQIILKNEEGVFVLTPHLNKSFRFQSGWPENQSQVYLYESLVRDIMNDEDRSFSVDGNDYVFETAANYQNRTLAQQSIRFDQNLNPLAVQVMDADYHVLVEVNFNHFEVNPTFEENTFDMQHNMEGPGNGAEPTVSQGEGHEEGHEEDSGSIGIHYPSYTPAHAELAEEEEVRKNGEPVVVLRYEGEYNFTIVQQRPHTAMVHMPVGEPVELGPTVGVKGEGNLAWTHNGVDFMITGHDMPEEEMVAVAQSMLDQAAK